MEYSLFAGLIQNIALLLVFSLLYATKWLDSSHKNNIRPNIYAGLVVGGISMLLISTPWVYEPGQDFDLRSVLLAISGLYLGPIPTIVGMIVSVVYRVFIGGDHMVIGVLLIMSSGTIGILWRYVQHKNNGKNSLLSLFIFGLVVHFIMIIIPVFLPQERFASFLSTLALPILVTYPLVTALLGKLLNLQLENYTNKKAKERLIESNQRFSNMMIDINMFFINVDLQGNIIFVNKYLLAATGYKEEEIMGQNSVELLANPNERDFVRNQLSKLLNGDVDQSNFEAQILTKNNDLLDVSWHSSVTTDSSGKILSVSSLGENITEKRITFEKLKEAKEKAEESNRLKSVFLQNISHEIRTPMNAIVGSLNILKEHENEKTREQFYKVLDSSAARLLSTVKDLIDISQVETRQISVKKSNLDLSELIANQIEALRPLAIRKNTQIVCTSKYLTEKTIIHTDKTLLFTILGNLLSNAVKFTQGGTIEIGTQDSEGEIVFYIKDNGVGIPANRLTEIFDRFVHADSSLSRSHEGTGLGLSIARAYANLLDGDIWVESELGKGSTFYFNLPLKSIPLTDLETAPITPELTISANLKILIAEDDKLNHLCLKKIIEQIGIETVHAKNGAEAVEMVKNDHSISLVLMDIKMPIMSGEEATATIRTFNQTLPIIAQTAFVLPDDREKYISIGCTDYISKPIEKNKLHNMLLKYLGS